jgi:hypothetical protein
VRLRIERMPEQAAQLSFQVAFMASAMLGRERPEALLQFVGAAGRDGTRGEDGTKRGEEWQARLTELVAKLGLTLRRGFYEG